MRRAAFSIVLALMVALMVACAPPPPESVTIRLLDLATEAEVRWPRQKPRRLPEGVDGPRTFRALRAQRVGRLAMFPRVRDGDSRLSLLAPAGTRYDFELTLPENAVLKIGLGYLPPAEEPGLPVRFSVFMTSEGGGGVLLDEEITTRVDGDWLEHRLDLSEFGGQTIDLTLQTRASVEQDQVWAAWGTPEIVRADAPEAGPDVILISLDTLRADRLGSYGYSRPTSPNLDAFAERSVRFASAVSQAPWTRPSHDSMFSGFYPSARERARAPVVAELLRAAGYRTEALTGGGQMDFRLGFARGFDAYRVFDWVKDLDELARWLDGSSHRRRFLFLHTYEIHDPYTHAEFVTGPTEGEPPTYSNARHLRLRGQLTGEQKELVSDLYDGGIAYTDREIGRLFELFESQGVFDRSIVVVTSDHGEQFWEHGSWRHGMNLYDHQLMVPLIVYLPPELARRVGGRRGVAGRVVERQVRLVDLVPTLMELLELPLGHRVDGRSLYPLFTGEDLPPVDAFSERLNIRYKEAKALRSERYKYVFSFPKAAGKSRGIPEARELYDLTRDPGEQNNLAAERPEVVEELDQRLQVLLRLLADPSELDEESVEELDPDLRERLEALGYIG